MLECARRPYITSMFSCSFQNTKIHTQPTKQRIKKENVAENGYLLINLNMSSCSLTTCVSLHTDEKSMRGTHVILEGTIVAHWFFFLASKYHHFCEKYFGKEGMFWCKFPCFFEFFFQIFFLNFKIGQKKIQHNCLWNEKVL